MSQTEDAEYQQGEENGDDLPFEDMTEVDEENCHIGDIKYFTNNLIRVHISCANSIQSKYEFPKQPRRFSLQNSHNQQQELDEVIISSTATVHKQNNQELLSEEFSKHEYQQHKQSIIEMNINQSELNDILFFTPQKNAEELSNSPAALPQNLKIQSTLERCKRSPSDIDKASQKERSHSQTEICNRKSSMQGFTPDKMDISLRATPRKYSHHQKKISFQFIKKNVESSLVHKLSSKATSQVSLNLKKNCLCQTDENNIPKEPINLTHIEKSIPAHVETLSRKNIDEKQMIRQSQLCDYYVKSLVNSVNSAERDNISSIYREHFLQSFHTFQISNTLQLSSEKEIEDKAVILPPLAPGKKKKTLILDLDETLIHCNESLDFPSDCIIDIPVSGTSEIIQTSINIRPHASEFLEKMSSLFEIVIFTASKEVYANPVLKKENCCQKGKVYVKDLRIFKNRYLKDIILVDNSCYSFVHNISNGIPIIPYYDDKNDQELRSLALLLSSLSELDDVRPAIRNIFKYKQYKKHENPAELIREIY